MLCLAQISRTFFSRRRSLLSLDSSFSKSVNIISTSWSVGDTSASKSLRKFIFIFSFRGFMLTYFGGKRESIFFIRENLYILLDNVVIINLPGCLWGLIHNNIRNCPFSIYYANREMSGISIYELYTTQGFV